MLVLNEKLEDLKKKSPLLESKSANHTFPGMYSAQVAGAIFFFPLREQLLRG